MKREPFQNQFFSAISHEQPGSIADMLDLGKEAEISFFMDLSPFHDSFRYRARHLALKVSNILIDPNGELDRNNLSYLLKTFTSSPYVIGPNRENDCLIYQHIGRSLQFLADNEKIWVSIRRFSPPLCHKKAEEFIRETLSPEKIKMVQAVHIRKAVVAAWLNFLRQTTGSCFATAPAILIQQQNPIQFFHDLYDLISTGQLKRVTNGRGYRVPLSFSVGFADLQRSLSSISSLETLAFSPPLIVALEAGEFFPPSLLMREKIQRLQSHLQGREISPNMEQLLRALLLEKIGLSENDLEDEEYLSRIQMTPLLAKQSAVYYQPPSERGQKVSLWKKQFSKSLSAFLSLSECPILRAWEYTIASLCDVKIDFARWNLYVGLGIHPDMVGGIGSFLYKQVDLHLQKWNVEAHRLSQEYEQALGATRAIEVMLEGAVNESRRHQLKAEWTSARLAANTILEMREEALSKAEALSQLFSQLLNQYLEKLQEYFQELFDPGLMVESHLIDDSPAGFRLVYKHGRSDASQWTAIHSGEEYIQSLREFFSNIESDISYPPQIGQQLISEITTSLIRFIQEPEFLKMSILRSQEKGRRSPWDYVSGGTVQTLLQAYCNRNEPLQEESKIIHSEEDLLQFLLNQKGEYPRVMHSPTHAFVFYPHLLPDESLTIASDNQRWTQKWPWNSEMQEYIAHRLSERLPEGHRPLFLHLFSKRNHLETRAQFRAHLINSLSSDIKNSISIVDSILYEMTPLLNHNEAEAAFRSILNELSKNWNFINRIAFQMETSFVGLRELHSEIKRAIFNSERKLFSTIDWDLEIVKAMRKLGLAPQPILFADSNWSGWFFGFVSHPTSGQLELWRLNRIATQGFPMSDWKGWMSPANSSPWVIINGSIET